MEAATIEDRTQISGNARRWLVRGLVRLASISTAFHDAAFALALLGEAENETWSNNATGEFANLYQVFLGGTSCPYLERLPVTDDLLQRKDPKSHNLAISALSQAADRHETRFGGPDQIGGPSPKEWKPKTYGDQWECIRAAANRLATAIPKLSDESRDALLKELHDWSMALRLTPVREPISEILKALITRFPDARESARRNLKRVIEGEKEHWKELSKDDLEWIEGLYGEFEDRSPKGIVMNLTSESHWGKDDPPMDEAVTAVLENPSLLAELWPWLTSGESYGSWALGAAIAKTENYSAATLNQMTALPRRGSDLRMIAGYIWKTREAMGQGWVDDWLDQYGSSHSEDIELIVDITWRCASSNRGANRLAGLLSTDKIPTQVVQSFTVGAWFNGPDTQEFLNFIDKLIAKHEFRTVAISLLEHRLSSKPEEWSSFKSRALQLVTDPQVLRSGSMTTHYWSQMAKRLLKVHGRELAGAIFSAQGDRGNGTWFLEHSEALQILWSCIESDALKVWQELEPHLANPKEVYLFSIGFPSGVLDRLPKEHILAWISEDPASRADIVGKLVAMDFSPASLASTILDRFGSNRSVGGALFSAYVSGGWMGPGSVHWQQLADSLFTATKTHPSANVKRWAKKAITDLMKMSERDKNREAEQELRGFG